MLPRLHSYGFYDEKTEKRQFQKFALFPSGDKAEIGQCTNLWLSQFFD